MTEDDNIPMAELKYWHPGTLSDVLGLLRIDGHGRLEGSVSEHLLMERLVKPLVGEVSRPFWFAVSSNKTYHVFYLTPRGEQIGRTAQAFLELLKARRQRDMKIHLVDYAYQNDAIEFRITASPSHEGWALQRAVKDMSAHDWTLSAERAKREAAENRLDQKYRFRYPPKFLRWPQQPGWAPQLTVGVRESRALTVIDQEMDARNLLAERIFVNQIIYRYYLYFYDLDSVGYVDGKLTGFELKRKYPTPAGKFGINEGLGGLFLNLASSLDIVHLVMASGRFEKASVPASPLDVIRDHPGHVKIFGKLLNQSTMSAQLPSVTVSADKFTMAPVSKVVTLHEGFTLVGDYQSPDLIEHLHRQIQESFQQGQLTGRAVGELLTSP